MINSQMGREMHASRSGRTARPNAAACWDAEFCRHFVKCFVTEEWSIAESQVVAERALARLAQSQRNGDPVYQANAALKEYECDDE